MKKIYVLASLAFTINAFAQNANVALSNINSNNGYSGYNTSTTVIEGIFFEVLADGTNSSDVLSDFQVSIYLLPCDASGTATSSTPVIAQTFTITGMNQLSAINYTNDSINLSQVSGLTNGMYRMGVWVDSDGGIPNPPNNPNDDAGLIQSSAGTDVGSIINYTSVAGIEKFAGINQMLTVYPNPSNGSFQVSFTDNIDELKVSDMVGQVVYEAKPNTTTTTLQLDNVGIYFITLTSGTVSRTQKIIITK